MRRLFSSFARGWPGTALLLMRLVAAAALFQQVSSSLGGPITAKAATFAFLAGASAALLCAGLWTPAAGVVVTLVELWSFLHSQNPWVDVLLGTSGICLALLGPGAWSVDAYLFGWKRIHVGPRPG